MELFNMDDPGVGLVLSSAAEFLHIITLQVRHLFIVFSTGMADYHPVALNCQPRLLGCD
jgi:hypothetical protein